MLRFTFQQFVKRFFDLDVKDTQIVPIRLDYFRRNSRNNVRDAWKRHRRIRGLKSQLALAAEARPKRQPT